MRTQKVSKKKRRAPKKRARPVVIPVRQNDSVRAEFFAVAGDAPKKLAPSENAWRKLAADAIKAYRDLANLTDSDEDRNAALTQATQLERRLSVLSGQQELFVEGGG